MKIDGTHNVNSMINKKNMSNTGKSENIEIKNTVTIEKSDLAATYERSMADAKASVYDLISIGKEKEASKDVYGQVVKKVEDTLVDQARKYDRLDRVEVWERGEGLKALKVGVVDEIEKALEMLKETAETLNRPNSSASQSEISGKLELARMVNIDTMESEGAKELIQLEESVSAEVVSEELVEFVKDASSGEYKKADALIGAVDKGFEEAGKTLDHLPDITQKTYDRTLEKLDSFIFIEKAIQDPENAELQIKDIIEKIVIDQTNIEKDKMETAKPVISSIKEMDVEEVNLQENTTDKAGISIDKKTMTEVIPEFKVITELEEGLSPKQQIALEEISGKLVNLIKAASNGDMVKLDNLMVLVEETFKNMEKNIGFLPYASQQTYETIMKELEKIEDELAKRKYPGPAFFAESVQYYKKKKRGKKFGMQEYVIFVVGSVILYYGIRYLMGL